MSQDKPLLILDLDETLVHGTEKPIPSVVPDFHVGPFAICKRPNLSEFLTVSHELFDVAVWSSASPDYVGSVTRELFTDTSELLFVWACDRCTRRYDLDLDRPYYAKNLLKVKKQGFDLKRVLMIDDSPEKLSQHYGNLMHVRPFEGDMSDTELIDIIPFLEWIADQPNFRSIEKRGWRKFDPSSAKFFT